MEVPVAPGQQADTVEDNLLQNINRLQFARTKAEDVEAARQEATGYLESAYVREWFASEALEDRREEGLQWIKSFTADDIRSYLSAKPGQQPVTSFKRFTRFLINTGRIDYDAGENLSTLLKQMSN